MDSAGTAGLARALRGIQDVQGTVGAFLRQLRFGSPPLSAVDPSALAVIVEDVLARLEDVEQLLLEVRVSAPGGLKGQLPLPMEEAAGQRSPDVTAG